MFSKFITDLLIQIKCKYSIVHNLLQFVLLQSVSCCIALLCMMGCQAVIYQSSEHVFYSIYIERISNELGCNIKKYFTPLIYTASIFRNKCETGTKKISLNKGDLKVNVIDLSIVFRIH